MSKPDLRRLTCTSCNHENEIERVYCHNCGEKLDRSLLPAVNEDKSDDDREKERKKVKSMMNPHRLSWLRTVKVFVLIELLAAAVAAGYLATQAPEAVPPAAKDKFPELEVGDVWAGMMSAKPSVAVTFKEFDLNYYLRKQLKGAEGPLGTKFVRAFTHLEPGLVTLGSERNAWGLPFYNSATFKPVLKDGKWSADMTRFAIGRLTIPPAFAKLVMLDSFTLGVLTKAFEREIKNLSRIEKIAPDKGVISFTTKPQQ